MAERYFNESAADTSTVPFALPQYLRPARVQMNTDNITPEEFAHLFTDLRSDEIEQIVDNRGVEFLESAEQYLADDQREAYIDALQSVIDSKREHAESLKSDIRQMRTDSNDE